MKRAKSSKLVATKPADSSSTPGSEAAQVPIFLLQPETFVPPILVILTCVKILLIPAYRSTDFDVHRNWLAITHNLPISEWYFDNVNGTTVHTLDYPPAFAFFEWILANNPLTTLFLPMGDRCLDLLPDYDNTPSPQCVIFQRSTVIVSDIILWIGSWMVCRAFHSSKKAKQNAVFCFLLIVLNPGLLWLDHVHFQYNGMLLGVLLASLACLMQGNNISESTLSYDLFHLAGACLYALLLNLKHLYLPLAPVYFFYLLGKYCRNGRRWHVKRFLALAIATLVTLILPWLPFVLQSNPKQQFLQILARLFPFGRGLVHDYWAANVWALFSLADKAVHFAAAKIPGFPLKSLPEPSPLLCAILLFLSILPVLVTVSKYPTNTKLLQSVVYTSFCAFMLAYHVHEKAIMTALIPMALLVQNGNGDATTSNMMYTQTALWGLLGLFPLLFRPFELTFKLASFWLYVQFVFSMLPKPTWGKSLQRVSVILACCILWVLEFAPIHRKWQFMPLMVTSIICACGLFCCWGLSLSLLLQR